ncbi:hypothetical protein VOM14_10750 [Paraburkholderia sp. MPAMCS5]|uniref:hypothetical protein n=1 Tax=Paraburkholderia sp. MPAMCS5 TaxID=3112563 RepID=UPI002E18F303|nr:hypothetical protein [Paraburkholderia sp. MPAMCS5]
MSYQNLDKEIAHLERVFVLISVNDRIPLSYWAKRLRLLSSGPLMPAQRERIARLEAMLCALRESDDSVRLAPPPRAKDAVS